jgi:hypothetical protein
MLNTKKNGFFSGPEGKKCPITTRLTGSGSFTSEFTTSVVGEHTIELVIFLRKFNILPHSIFRIASCPKSE